MLEIFFVNLTIAFDQRVAFLLGINGWRTEDAICEVLVCFDSVAMAAAATYAPSRRGIQQMCKIKLPVNKK